MSASPSSTQFSSSLSSTSSSSPSPTSTDNVDTLSKNSSLLFGFLVSVLSLFGIFMMSGLIWHRLVMRRRMIDELLRMNAYSERREFRKPRLCDVLASSGRSLSGWEDAQPLAVEIQRTISPPPQDSRITRHSFWKRLIDHAPREITYLFSPPSTARVADPSLSSHTTKLELPVDNSHVQVSVLIAMPQRPDALSSTPKDNGLGRYKLSYEVVLGSTDVLYHDSDIEPP